MILFVDQPGALQNGDEIIEVAVNVADGDHGIGMVHGGFGWSRPCQADQHQEKEERKKKHGEEKHGAEEGTFLGLL